MTAATDIRAAQTWTCTWLIVVCAACPASREPTAPPRELRARETMGPVRGVPSTQVAVPPSLPEPARATTSATAVAAEHVEANAAISAAGSSNVIDVLTLSGAASTSIGGPSSGRLRGGVAMPDRGPGFYHNPKRPDQARYGTVELVQAIVRAAALVDAALPGSGLTVNDLGLLNGGPIPQHGSHQAGRDADILFYVLDEHGAPVPSVGVPIDPKGKGWDFKDLTVPEDDLRVQLDAARTWQFVAALLEQANDAVQRIFIVEHVRSMLLNEAKRVHAPRALVQRFEEVTCQPDAPHDDHMHVRLFCTPEDTSEGCLDSAPMYPWHVQALQVLGRKPLLAAGRQSKEEREAVAKRTTTAAEARKKAGRMHARVIQFLAERESWLKKPSPGRLYCK